MYVLNYNVNIQTVLPSGSEGPRATTNPLIMAMNNGIKRKYKSQLVQIINCQNYDIHALSSATIL